MWVYWTLFWWPALAAVGLADLRKESTATKSGIWAFLIMLTLVIGLRFEVGVDWGNYLGNLYASESYGFLEILQQGDPAYGLLNWIGVTTGSGIWLVNLVSAIAFASGLVAFCRQMPNPWLALAVGVPYMAIVMAMNYTRQGAAFGLVLWGLLALQDGRVRRFAVFIILASLFHKTAVVLLPLAAFAYTRNRWWTILWIGITTALAYLLFISETEDLFYENYILAQYSSDGAGIRVAMNAVAAIAFLIVRNHIDMTRSARSLWTWVSLIVLAFIPALMLSPSSTAVDRIALYFMPIQLVAFSYFPNIVRHGAMQRIVVLSVVAGYWTVMYVWFNYSNFYWAWLPYQFYPFAA